MNIFSVNPQTKTDYFFSRAVKVLRLILYKTTQKALLIITYILMYGFFDFRIEGKENARIKKGPLLVISNHKSFLDPPLLGICFSFFSKIYPLRFITHDNFFKNLPSWLLFKSLGSYPACAGQGMEKSLEKPIEVLKKGGTVIFFPEGKLYFDNEIHEPKLGVGILALKFPDVLILPVAIFGTNRTGPFWSIIFRRPRVRMKIGKPFRLIGKTVSNDPQLVSNLLMKEIEELYRQIR